MSFTRNQPDVLSFLCRNLKRIDYTDLENQLFECSFTKDPTSTVDEYIEQLHRDSDAGLNRAATLHSATKRVGKHRDTRLRLDAVRRRCEN